MYVSSSVSYENKCGIVNLPLSHIPQEDIVPLIATGRSVVKGAVFRCNYETGNKLLEVADGRK
jgi:hypothetical protein